MKKLLLFAATALLLNFIPIQSQAQTLSFDRPLIWGTSPFQDSIWAIDTSSMTIVSRMAPSVPGYTITGITGMATDPTTGITYVIAKVSGVTGRCLATINLGNAVCTFVNGPVASSSSLGTNYSSLTFDSYGQLYGAIGNGGSPSESLNKINKTNCATTFMFTMGNGADGEIICYNKLDSNIYHWSGNGTVVMEKWFYTNASYTPTNIPISGSPGGETFGMLYNDGNKFIVSNISSALTRVSAAGVYGSSFMSNPDDLRGLVMLPYFIMSDDTICQNESLTLSGGGHQLYDNFIYHWGDGNSDTIATVDGVLTVGNHTYSTAGNYNVQVETDNGFGGDTVYTFQIRVNNIPVVAISGLAAICSGDSTTLTATSGGTSQWYMNGSPIVGANTNTYSTDQPGVYNMIKTNLNGCADSAAVGTNVVVSSNPVVSLGGDIEGCLLYTISAGNPGMSYLWNTGDTTQAITIYASDSLSVIVTNADGCTGMDSINITINPLPTPNLGPDTAACLSYTLSTGLTGMTYLWCDGSTTPTTTMFSSGTCSVMVTDTNGCSAMDTINVVINSLPTVTLTSMMDSMCISTPPVPLFGSPMGGTFSGPGTTMNTFTPSVAGAGVHAAVYMATDSNGCTGSDTLMLSVFANPTVTASAAPSAVCIDDASVTLTGSPAGGTFTGTSVTGNSFDPSVGVGSYNIIYMVTDANGCSGNDTTSVQVNACVGIEETNANDFTMYPNPTTGVLNFNLNANAVVEVYDVLGNVLVAKQLNAGVAQIDLSNEPNGVYFVRVNGANAQRVILQK